MSVEKMLKCAMFDVEYGLFDKLCTPNCAEKSTQSLTITLKVGLCQLWFNKMSPLHNSDSPLFRQPIIPTARNNEMSE